ncbi:dienelactone hydrolase family protein [Nocardia stercoris]|uniref:Carboxymethylenebutenolidase n=1 Tax=Nocardia stercoris TaxID=2483361 RepID=A0A3M2LB24_9NOCA|nr:dienelactone hydrolase family protein [Nocardia stercoris]RMI34256.1 carboxymethylenebutenolidase [Nocardia stercoris]
MSGSYRAAALLRTGTPGDVDAPPGTEQVPITVIEPSRTARGGIIVLHESRDFTDVLTEFMNSLAAEGWIVVAPDLFYRSRGTGPVFGAELFADVAGCFDWLRGRGVFGDCIGLLGFDTAGTAAVLAATDSPIGAVVSVAPRGIATPVAPDAEALAAVAPRLRAPWLALFGADDPDTPAAEVEELREAAAHASVATLLVTYPGLHHRPDRPAFDILGPDDDVTAVDAQTRIFEWFDSHLR